MKSSESLVALYNIVNKQDGPVEARRFLKVAIGDVIGDLQDEGLEVNEDNIERRLVQLANDFISVATNKNDVA